MTNWDDTVRFGVVGYAKGGRYFHAPLIDGAAGCSIGAILARSAPNVAAAQADHPGVPVVGTLREMVGRVDAVAISTPLDTHAALAHEALALGLPVVLDKPFARTVAEAAAVLADAEARGVPFCVYQNRRYDGDVLTVVAAVQSGALGEVRHLESRMEQQRPPGGVARGGGGVLLDLGSHVVDQALMLLGPAVEVHAEMRGASDGSGLDEWSWIGLRHAGGATSHLLCSFALRGPAPARFRVEGDRGTLVVPDFDAQADRLLAGGSPRVDGDRFGVTPPGHAATLHTDEGSTTIPIERGRWVELYERFALAVRGEGPLPVDPHESLAALVVLEAAGRAAHDGTPVRLGDPG